MLPWFHQKGLESSLEQMACFSAKAIEASGIGALQPLHSSGEISIRSRETEMKVVSHYAVRRQQPGEALAGFEQRVAESVSSARSFKDEGAVVASIDYMVDGVVCFDARLSRHEADIEREWGNCLDQIVDY